MESKNGEDNPSKGSSFNGNGSSSSGSSSSLGILNPNSRITRELFNRRNYSEWSFSAEALGGTRNWDMLMEPNLNYPKMTLSMLNGRHKIC